MVIRWKNILQDTEFLGNNVSIDFLRLLAYSRVTTRVIIYALFGKLFISFAYFLLYLVKCVT